MLTCVGIGAGPANLSLACQLEAAGADALFLDRKPGSSWHEGMQIDGVKLQVSIFKDLVTLADPKSPYSFLSYLHENKRLYHFLNAQYDAVSRREFANYIAWVSQRLPSVGFDESVREVLFDGTFCIRTDKRTLRARNVSIAVGKTPKVPSFIEDKLCASLFHSADFTMKGRALGGKRVVIVGAANRAPRCSSTVFRAGAPMRRPMSTGCRAGRISCRSTTAPLPTICSCPARWPISNARTRRRARPISGRTCSQATVFPCARCGRSTRNSTSAASSTGRRGSRRSLRTGG
ncbi:MAG: SidA/IucD/PvdA family monooxygenase [Rhodobacteraceae bacterium]|nr:SidA/IucD/PvdA family monooxygenase [Paracoccaceae bacterium]